MVDSLPKKVFVLALDGATFDLIKPWAEAGKLPLFRQLMSNSGWGEIESTIPPITPVAWLSFMTGKNPGQHGVYDFFRPIEQDYRELNPAMAEINHQPTLWRILSDRGRKVCLLNVPMTYPPESVNGYLYSGVPAPTGGRNYTFPPELDNELQASGWNLSKNAALVRGTYQEYLTYLKQLVVDRTEATLHLMSQERWDFFMVHYLETDQVLHTYWRFLNEDVSEDDDLATAMLNLYQCVETQMARIIKQFDDETSLIILSDHGMGPVNYHLFLNNWLINEGFMVWRRNVSTYLRRFSYTLGFTPSNLYRRIPQSLLKRFSLGQVREDLAQIDVGQNEKPSQGLSQIRKRILVSLLRLPFLDFGDIDWSRTQAYSTGTTQAGFIHLNLKGREPQGNISETDYEQIRDEIKARLLAWENPFTGRKMVKAVMKREEIYHGDQLNHAPDLIVSYHETDYEAKKGSIFLSNRAIEPVEHANATHRMPGILFLSGSFFSPGPFNCRPNLLDMAPLILYLMDEAIPTDFEGKFHESLIEPSLLQKRTPRWVEPIPTAPFVEEDTLLSNKELDSVVEQLRNLGYLE